MSQEWPQPFPESLSPELAHQQLTLGVRRMYQQALTQDSAGVAAWRAVDNQSDAARRVRQMFDSCSASTKATRPFIATNERDGSCMGQFLQSLATGVPPSSPDVATMIRRLQESESNDGAKVNVLALLSDKNVSFSVKEKWFTQNVLSMVRFLDGRDRADAEEKSENDRTEREQPKNDDQNQSQPPPDKDRMKPGMDEMTKGKEGEQNAWFTAHPFYGGYWREKRLSTWDSATMEWVEESSDLRDVEHVSSAEGKRIITSSVRCGSRLVLPVPYGFIVDPTSLIPSTVTIRQNDAGKYIITALDVDESVQSVAFSVAIVRGHRSIGGSSSALNIPSQSLSTATETLLTELRNKPLLEQIAKLKRHVKTVLKYSNDSSMNAVHQSGDPSEYLSRIESSGKADCDVANTFFLGLCSRLGIIGGLAVGHFVKSADAKGATAMHSGTAHAWSEIWNPETQEWIVADATPPGDPNKDNEENPDEDQEPTSSDEGDFGEQDATDPSDEELQEMKEEVEKAERKAEAERKAREPVEKFAKEAGISSVEAEQVMKVLQRARETTDKQGRNILRRLQQAFSKLVQANIAEVVEPSRTTMSRGVRLDDPMAYVISRKLGDKDPDGFVRGVRAPKFEQVYGGFDVVLEGDKSGSMNEIQSDGLKKWQKQQVMLFLIAEAIFEASKDFKRNGTRLLSPVDIRLGVVSFSNGSAVEELAMGTEWGPKQQAQLWKRMGEGIGGGTPDQKGLALAGQMLETVSAGKPRKKLVLLSADGGSDSAAATVSAKTALQHEGIVVKAAGIGDGAKSIESTYGKDGKHLDSYDDLPDWAAEHVLGEMQALMPRKR